MTDEQQGQTDYFRDELFTPNAVSDAVPQHNGQEPHNGNPDAGQEGPSEEEMWYSTPLEGAIYQPHEASGWFLEPEPAQPHVARLGGGGAPDGYGQSPGAGQMHSPGRTGQNGPSAGSYPGANGLPPPGADPFMPPASQAFSDEPPPFHTPPQIGTPMPWQSDAMGDELGSPGMRQDPYGADSRVGRGGGSSQSADDSMLPPHYGNVDTDFSSLSGDDDPAPGLSREAPPPYLNPFDAQDPSNPLHADALDDPLMPVRRMQPSHISPPTAMPTNLTGLPALPRSSRHSASAVTTGLPIALGDLVTSSLSPAAGLSAAALSKSGKKKRKPVF